MIDAIFRSAAILLMIGVILGAGRILWWLGSAWFPRADVVPLAVQSFDVSHGDKVEKEEGRYLATHLVKEIQRIQSIMSADLSQLGYEEQVLFESVAPKSLNLAPEVSVKFDIEVKAFDVDVVGVVEKLHNFFDRADRLEVSMWVNENIKIFGALKTRENERSIGPWWLEKQENELQAVETFASSFALDLYRTRVRGLDGLDAGSFKTFVYGLDEYHEYLKKRHDNLSGLSPELLNTVADLLQRIADSGKASAIVYSYLGSVRSLQNRGDAAIEAYNHAVKLNPEDAFATRGVTSLLKAKELQPVPAAATAVGHVLDALAAQPLPGYVVGPLPKARRSITIAVIGTGISPELSSVLGARLLRASSTVRNEPDIEDHFGHGTSVTALTAALAPSANFIAIKSLSESGAGDIASVAEGVRLATVERADVILLPLGSPESEAALEAAIAQAMTAGALVIAAAGNNSSDKPSFPARQSGVLAVGAVNQQRMVADFSNHGTGVIYAPGVDILVLGQGGKLVRQSGTSFSAAVAAAIAAIVWAMRPEDTANQIRELLNTTAMDLGPVKRERPQLGEVRLIDGTAALRGAHL